MIEGKPAAKVPAWEKTRGGFPIVMTCSPISSHIRSIDQIPKRAKRVEIVLIGRNWRIMPETTRWVSREELSKYYFIG